eukprot:CAMPEP_0201931604 /NCGR_PEP_ID=MMETSP0903-20130614/27726_1 /ASSEMBLY_ACC=CAM_ASM_000552 /TAXON_ID=420261 /ORGANISM="Thalassiosira antarctica, Strain CCMP982" /LENGTH=418 /DNA_ID=CAMNT_0048470989 /DNA_START=51 /DNA_END=1304 /DNA_ORIENTATION=-
MSASPSSEETTIPAITERFLALTQNPNTTIVIDMENVRGKTNFELDHADFLDRLMVWTSQRNHALGRTIVVVDHGSRSSAHLLHGHGNGEGASLCVAFAGPHVKADDIIARDVRWLLSSPDSTTQHVVVITADVELAWRCRSATRSFLAPNVDDNGIELDSAGGRKYGKQQRGKKGGRKKSRGARQRQYLHHQEEEQSEEEEQTESIANDTDTTNDDIVKCDDNELQNSTVPTVEIIAPQRFLEDLEQALHEWLQQQEQHFGESNNSDDAPIPIDNIPIPTPVTTLQSLFSLRGQILSIESSLRKKCTLRKRHLLTGELRDCKEEWKDILSLIATTKNGEEIEDKTSLASSLAWSLSSTISSWDNDGDDTSILPLSPLPSSTSMSWEQLTPADQEKLLLRWGKRRGRHGTRREKTEDR